MPWAFFWGLVLGRAASDHDRGGCGCGCLAWLVIALLLLFLLDAFSI